MTSGRYDSDELFSLSLDTSELDWLFEKVFSAALRWADAHDDLEDFADHITECKMAWMIEAGKDGYQIPDYYDSKIREAGRTMKQRRDHEAGPGLYLYPYEVNYLFTSVIAAAQKEVKRELSDDREGREEFDQVVRDWRGRAELAQRLEDGDWSLVPSKEKGAV